MKTIQLVLKETDHKEIEKAYFYEHPININEMEEHADKTIGEVMAGVSARFQSFLDRLCNMEVEKGADKQGVLFAYKSSDGFLGGIDVGLIHADELLSAENVAEVSVYAYEFTEQKETLGFLVADNKLTQDNLMDVIVSFLYEVSFFGFEQENLESELKSLDKAINEFDEHPENCKECGAALDEIRKKYELPTEEKYPRERELKRKYFEAESKYIEYCKKIELERLKLSLQS